MLDGKIMKENGPQYPSLERTTELNTRLNFKCNQEVVR